MEQLMITTTNNNKHHHNNNILSRMHRESHTTVSKNKPQVRIIHIFAPEIIKTDPANFMELVQRLTGKPNSSAHKRMFKKAKKSTMNKRRGEGRDAGIVKSEEAAGIWRSSSSLSGGLGEKNDDQSGGYLTGFADMDDHDGFMEQLGPFQSSLDLLPHNHIPVTMHHQQQQQHHFFGEEDRSRNRMV